MNIDKEREAFEQVYAVINGLSGSLIKFTFEKNGTEYVNLQTKRAFDLWLASALRVAEKLEGCVVVPVEPTDAWMANYIDSGVEKYCEQFIGQKFAITEKEKPSIKEEWRGPVRKAHALVLKVVEAARGVNEH